MRIAGWLLVALSAFIVAFVSRAQLGDFVLSPAGGWVAIVWLIALVGGVVLIVHGNPPGEAFRLGPRAMAVIAVVVVGIPAVAIIIPLVNDVDPSTETSADGCTVGYAKLAEIYERVMLCMVDLDAPSALGSRNSDGTRRYIKNPLDGKYYEVAERDYYLLSVPGRTLEGVCGVAGYRSALSEYQRRCDVPADDEKSVASRWQESP